MADRHDDRNRGGSNHDSDRDSDRERHRGRDRGGGSWQSSNKDWRDRGRDGGRNRHDRNGGPSSRSSSDSRTRDRDRGQNRSGDWRRTNNDRRNQRHRGYDRGKHGKGSFGGDRKLEDSTHGKKKRGPSFGVVPWFRVGPLWLVLLQTSYSASLFNWKLDPLRGSQEKGETPWQAAAREAYEESRYVLDLRATFAAKEDAEPRARPGQELFHVICSFGQGLESADADLNELLGAFDTNPIHVDSDDTLRTPETVGLVVTRVGNEEATNLTPLTKLRFASQVKNMRFKDGPPATAPHITLVRAGADQGASDAASAQQTWLGLFNRPLGPPPVFFSPGLNTSATSLWERHALHLEGKYGSEDRPRLLSVLVNRHGEETVRQHLPQIFDERASTAEVATSSDTAPDSLSDVTPDAAA